MISHFVKNIDDLKLFHEKTPKIRFDALIFVGAIPEIWYKKYGGLIGPKNVEILEFQKVEMCQDNEFLKWFPIFSYIVWSKIVMKRRGEGPPRVQKIENFGSSQNHPKSIGIGQESNFGHFGIIKAP